MKKELKSFAPLIGICLFIAFFTFMPDKKEKTLPSLTPDEKAELDCKTNEMNAQNDEALMALKLRPEEILKFSVADTIKSRRKEEAYCLKIAACAYHYSNKQKDDQIFAMTFDSCLEDIVVQQVNDGSYQVEPDYP